MVNISTNEFKAGIKVIFNNEPHMIIQNEFVSPGKGQAFNRIKLKNLINNKILEKTLRSGDSLVAAEIEEITVQFLFTQANIWHFMNTTDYSQISIDNKIIGDNKFWINTSDTYQILIWDGNPINILVPNFVEMKILEADYTTKSDTITTSMKNAILECGANIRVPIFIEVGDVIKIDTRSIKYISRIYKNK